MSADNALIRLNLSRDSINEVSLAEAEVAQIHANIERIELNNQARVLASFQKEGVALRHFSPTNGYGYDDIGRDALDRVFAHALQSEDALVRPQITSGTHAIYLALSGLLTPGDIMLSVTGKPYDTLEEAIGISGTAPNSLSSQGVQYRQIDLNDKGEIDLDSVSKALCGRVRVIYIQRSRGYSWRNALAPDKVQPVAELAHHFSPQAVVVVDNCYGEFTCIDEPTVYGADILAGSLIKNPGGGLSPTGGYIAGKAELIDRIAQRMTVPGCGREVGSYIGGYGTFYQGLFLAPHTVAQSLKTAVLFARLFERRGMETLPGSSDMRSDIIQSLRFNTAEELIAFCRSIQSVSPVDSNAVPEPWNMPGYRHQVIMAAGAFVQGSSIELSADAPLVKPYTAYIQGGLTYGHGKIAAMHVLDSMKAFAQ